MRSTVAFTFLLAPLAIQLAKEADAANFNVPVPLNAFITHNGADWAWANPLPPDVSFSGFDISYQATQGWRIPTAQELKFAPLATDFLFAGANVPLGGADPVSGARFDLGNGALNNSGAVAVPYFSTRWNHADWRDGLGQPMDVWAGMPGASVTADQLVIRGHVIPEPGAFAMLDGAVLLAGLWQVRSGGWHCRGRRWRRVASEKWVHALPRNKSAS